MYVPQATALTSREKVCERFKKMGESNLPDIPFILKNLQKSQIWEQFQAELPEYFPNHHEEITQAFHNALQDFSLNDVKDEKSFNKKIVQLERLSNISAELPANVTKALKEAALTQEQEKAISRFLGTRTFKKIIDELPVLKPESVYLLFKNFEKDYGKTEFYCDLDWEPLYQYRKKAPQFKKRLGEIYVRVIKEKSNPTPIESIRADILGYYRDYNRNFSICLDVPNLDAHDIAELCAEADLRTNEENAIWTALPEDSRDLFLLERFKYYCNEENLESLRSFFGSICYKLYYKQMQEVTFRLIVEHMLSLSSEIRDEILKAPEFLSCKVEPHYRCCFVMAQAKMQPKEIIANLNILVEKHVTTYKLYAREILYGQILSVFSYIRALELPEELYRPILEVFKSAKKHANSLIGSARGEYDKKSWYGVDTKTAESEWTGAVEYNFLRSWLNKNTWVSLSDEDKRNPDLLVKTKQLLKLIPFENEINDAKLNPITTSLRKILSEPLFIHSYKRFLSLGLEEAGPATRILLELVYAIFTQRNTLPYLVTEMKNIFAIGLEELAKKHREIWYLAEKELLKYCTPLRMPFELQHEVINALPEKFKTSFSHVLNSATFRFLTLKIGQNNVDLFRLANQGITPEFKVFLGKKRFLFLTLEKQLPIDATENIFVVSLFDPMLPASLDFSQIDQWMFKGIPEEWREDQVFKKAIKSSIDEVKAILYPHSTQLSETHTRIFFKFLYARLALYMISYTKVSNFAFIFKGQEFFNPLIVKILSILFESNIAHADFTFDEMARAMLCGAKIEKRHDAPLDELSEAFAILEDPDVQRRLKMIGFGVEKMNYPEF